VRGELIVWGIAGDEPLDDVRSELVRRNVPHVFLDQREMQTVEVDLEFDYDITGYMKIGSRLVAVDEVGAFYVRPYNIREILRNGAAAPDDEKTELRAVTAERQIFAWADSADVLVVNRPTAMASNLSKPLQLELIRAQGFEIPETLVTTTPEAVQAFISQHGRVICKSVSAQRSMATSFDESDLGSIADVAHCATQFQEYILGVDWRVHVVGDELFACEVHCDADDYRFAHRDGVALKIVSAQLPESVAHRCVALARSLDLPLAGIDLRRTSDDAWYCFEVNPAPAFSFYQRAANQPLSAAIVDLLLAGCAA
jgi:hypothetical protein